MRIGLVIFALFLPTDIEAAVHLYGVRKGEKAPAGFIIHKDIPKWAVFGNGWLKHWKGKDGKWWQKRIPRPRPKVCYT